VLALWGGDGSVVSSAWLWSIDRSAAPERAVGKQTNRVPPEAGSQVDQEIGGRDDCFARLHPFQPDEIVPARDRADFCGSM